ncbi:cytochrome c551 [Planococcus salinus]|uniref:Cytochrome c n=1 Tax=Planococcus salinus TaxID=1848460 RepID=A0A3M8P388_9BACL|nr:cytochrome c [Planococcus salinus]RNF38188.1 cytochrome c [Planococcus salinus]
MKKQLMALFFGSALLLGACGGGEETTEPADEAPVENPGGEEAEESTVDAEAVVNQNCTSCHGENLEGAGNFPALNDVGSRLSEEEIREIIDEGQGSMPPDIIEGEEADAVAQWLSEQQ